MNIYHTIIGSCWLALFAAWGFLALIFGAGGRRNPSSMGVIGMVLFIVVFSLGFRYGGRVQLHLSGSPGTGMAAAGAVLCIAGLMFATWARVELGRNWGMPMALHETPELVTQGPYQYVRHPIYTGIIAMWIGTSLVYPLATPAGVAVVMYTFFSALREERDMEQRFPETYPEYRKRSKMLLPFLI